MRVAIADDHVLLREGLARLLAEAEMEVVLQAPDVERLLAGVERTRPDVAVIDIRLPPTFTDEGLRAADAIRERHPGIAVVVLSQYLESAYALRLLERFPVDVPFDRADPRAGTIAIAYELHRHSGPGPADGAIVVNFGGPGPSTARAGSTARWSCRAAG